MSIQTFTALHCHQTALLDGELEPFYALFKATSVLFDKTLFYLAEQGSSASSIS